MFKKSSILILILALIFILSSPIQANADGVRVEINGVEVAFTQDSGQPFIDSANRTQVPLRVTMEAYGCNVDWDSSNKIAIVEKDNIVVKIPIGAAYILVNGYQITNDTKAQIKDGKTFLPIRVVLEAFGANVSWNKSTNIVEVASTVEPSETNTITYEDGSLYIGEIKNGVPNGTGTYTWPDGEKYVGSWVDGYQQGNGTYTWANGDKYTGAWLKDNRTGYGTYTWADGTKYVGYFLNGLQQGSGTEYGVDGSVLKGEWLEGQIITEVLPPSVIRAKATSTSEIEIGWDQVSGADYYYIYFSSSISGPWNYFSDTSNNIQPQYWLDTYSSSIYGIKPNTTLYFKITSVKDGVESKPSSITSATTYALTPVLYPTVLPTITSDFIKSKIWSDFDGLDYGNVYELLNGQFWKQVSYTYEYEYEFMPEVIIYKDGLVYKMKVENCDKEATVILIN